MGNEIFDIIIIGSGPAGLTATIYTSRANLKTLLIGGIEFGGQLMLTTDVEDYPGFPDGTQGPELILAMKAQAEKFGSRILQENVTSVDFSKKPFAVYVGEKKYLAKAIIISTGASAKWLDIPGEKKLIGKGVSSCAVCDAAFFKGKKVVVVGGGDSAMREALFLTKFVSSVTIIHRRDKLRAFPILVERASKNPKVSFIWDTIVTQVLGVDKVGGVILKNVRTGKQKHLETDGLFVAIGHSPNTQIFRDRLPLDPKGYIIVKNETKTPISGVFVAGDVSDWHYQQAVTAAGIGCRAAIDAHDYLENLTNE